MKIDRHGQAKVLSSDEAKQLFDAFPSDRDRALFGFCLFTGCRINEACTMLSSDTPELRGIAE